jgi:hypothetical protein
MSHNLCDKTLLEQQADFNIGLKVETGTLESGSDVVRAMTLMNELVTAGILTKDHVDNMKMDLAMKLSGLKISEKIK